MEKCSSYSLGGILIFICIFSTPSKWRFWRRATYLSHMPLPLSSSGIVVDAFPPPPALPRKMQKTKLEECKKLKPAPPAGPHGLDFDHDWNVPPVQKQIVHCCSKQPQSAVCQLSQNRRRAFVWNLPAPPPASHQHPFAEWVSTDFTSHPKTKRSSLTPQTLFYLFPQVMRSQCQWGTMQRMKATTTPQKLLCRLSPRIFRQFRTTEMLK